MSIKSLKHLKQRSISFLFLSFLLSCQSLKKSYEKPEKALIVAHRGASGYLPEHTLAAYELGIKQGADYIECDVVSTKDHVLICRHENEISETTDVARKFPHRKTKKVIDGKEVEGWFSEDFTLEEIKTLRAKERLPFRKQNNNGLYSIPTFEEHLELALNYSQKLGRPIGIYPETKHPTYFRNLRLPLEDKLLEILSKYGLNHAQAPVLIQSFETDNLMELAKKTEVRLIQLIDTMKDDPRSHNVLDEKLTYEQMLTKDNLPLLASYAHGISPHKSYLLAEPRIIEWAHQAGLWVHTFTFRNEVPYLDTRFLGNPSEEVKYFLQIGIDGFFTDFPDTAFKVRKDFNEK